jgi:hypothetical protein
MRGHELIVIYMKKIEVASEAGCENKTTHHRRLCFSMTSRLATRRPRCSRSICKFEDWKPDAAKDHIDDDGGN